MKNILTTIMILLVWYGKGICQCAQPALKIQTAACDTPRNLKAQLISNTQMEVSWMGSKNRTYILDATYHDPLTNNQAKARTSEIKCDSGNNYVATVFMKEAAVVNWSVRAICNVENAVLYSAEVKAEETAITVLPKQHGGTKLTAAGKLSVHPNPSAGYIIIEYPYKVDADVRIRVFDLSGKQALNTTDNGSIRSNSNYKLDLHNLGDGIYLLELNDGKNISSVKFELFKQK